jgi:hypothetical protein
MTVVEELAPRVEVLEARHDAIAEDLWAIRQNLYELTALLRDQAEAAAQTHARLADQEAKLDAILARCDRGRSALLPARRWPPRLSA